MKNYLDFQTYSDLEDQGMHLGEMAVCWGVNGFAQERCDPMENIPSFQDGPTNFFENRDRFSCLSRLDLCLDSFKVLDQNGVYFLATSKPNSSIKPILLGLNMGEAKERILSIASDKSLFDKTVRYFE